MIIKDYDYAAWNRLLATSKNIMVVGHTSPDGDTVGSSLALGWLLKALDKNVQVVFADDLPLSLKFLPGADKIAKPAEVTIKPDLIVLVDCATLDRVGSNWLQAYLPNTTLGVIDHHALRDEIGAIELIDPQVAATGELIYALAIGLGVEISLNMAICMYAAISSDTGGFRFANTTKQSFAIGGALVEIGVDMEQMRINLFETRSMASMKILGRSLDKLQQSEDGKIVWTYIDLDDKCAVGALNSDCDNISGFTMFPTGVKVGAFFKEVEAEDGVSTCVKVSLRSRTGYNVGAVAAGFGGGGHVLAAGCKIHRPLKVAMAEMLEAIRAMITETENKQ